MGMIGCFASATTSDLQRLEADPDQLDEYLYPNDGESNPPHYTDVDKAWQAIHFMLTGSPDGGTGAAAIAILGGTEIGEDTGYGPARVLTPAQVQAVAAELLPLPADVFGRRYNPAAMDKAGVYPEIWVRDGADGLKYILGHYQNVRAFYLEAAARGDGAILWLS